jgi:hypothetical protein
MAEGALRVGVSELAGAVRWVAQVSGDERGRRAVASLVWRGPVGPVRATLGGNWAWGDPVAVSTVTTPVAVWQSRGRESWSDRSTPASTCEIRACTVATAVARRGRARSPWPPKRQDGCGWRSPGEGSAIDRPIS